MFGFGWDLRPGGERSEISWEIYVAHDRRADAASELTVEEATLAGWIATTPQDPFRQSREFLLAAWSSAQRGRFVHATVEAGTAVEVLVSASLRVAGPHFGYGASKLANVLEGAFASRLKDHFAVLLDIAAIRRSRRTRSGVGGKLATPCATTSCIEGCGRASPSR